MISIKVAGPGCPRGEATEKNVFNACAELEREADISHVHDFNEYAKIGIMLTPAVLVNGKVMDSGKIPSVEELKRTLSDTKE